jgi:DNA-binding response OmpR family regulator
MAAPLIAVVNHDPVFLRLMESILTLEGYEVVVINDGTSAYEAIKRDRPQAIVVDTWLGERHAGWDLIQVLRLDNETASIPILVCSSDDAEEVKKKLAHARKSQSMATLPKPFDTHDLLSAVKQMLDGTTPQPSDDSARPDSSGP